MTKKENLNIRDNHLCNLKIEGRKGTWYAVKSFDYHDDVFYELESEQYGDEAEHIIVNKKTMTEPSEDFASYLLYGLN